VRLPDLLVSEGVVHPDTVVEVFEAQALYGGSFDTNLLELGVIDERHLLPYLERAHGIGNRVDVLAEPAVEALHRVPREQAEQARICPFRLTGRTLDVVCSDPADARALEEIARVSGARVEVSVAIEARVALHLYRGYGTPMPNRLVSVLKGRTWPKPIVSGRRRPPPGRAEAPRGAPPPSPGPEIDLGASPLVSTAPNTSLLPVAPDESVTEQVLRLDPAELQPPLSSPPVTESELQDRLAELAERDQIPPLILGYLLTVPRVVLLRVRKTECAGWDASGEAHDAIQSMTFSLETPSIFATIANDVSPFEGSLPQGPIELGFINALGGGRWPEHIVLVPIRVKGRVVAMIYAELGQGAPPDAREMALQAARAIASTLVRMILAKKAGS
jgi:hypothetical protein